MANPPVHTASPDVQSLHAGGSLGLGASGAIWLHAIAYFACYVPYVGLTKLMSTGALAGDARIAGAALLPISTLASGVGMVAYITWRGWWRNADQRAWRGRSWPVPDRVTAVSGLATAAVIATTTLSYSVTASVLSMMVLMRGGVLALAPLIDWLSRRPIQPRSWVALGLCFGSIALGVGGAAAERLDAGAIAVVAVYLGSYAVRLRAMSRQAKRDEEHSATRFFVQEQMVATPALVLFLGVAALAPTPWSAALRHGLFEAGAATPWLVAIGLLSQGTGIFGALVLLDARENAFCVPLNRASSVLAGLVATTIMALAFAAPGPTSAEVVAAGLLIAALIVLGWPTKAPVAAAACSVPGGR
jgi:hypothetical protein